MTFHQYNVDDKRMLCLKITFWNSDEYRSNDSNAMGIWQFTVRLKFVCFLFSVFAEYLIVSVNIHNSGTQVEQNKNQLTCQYVFSTLWETKR